MTDLSLVSANHYCCYDIEFPTSCSNITTLRFSYLVPIEVAMFVPHITLVYCI